MRLLLLEDEKKVADFVVSGLKVERCAVDVVDDGETGWAMAKASEYDLVILDLMLPRMTGTEVLKRIRRQDNDVPVLIVTAKDAMGDKVATFEAGADDYLTKPFAFVELLVTVRAVSDEVVT